MDIKIPSGPIGCGAADAITNSSDAAGAAKEISKAPDISPTMDSVSAIAEQVARGEIGQKEAVERILCDILDSKMVSSAPVELKQELSEALRALIEEDPYLKSLTASIGAAKIE